MGKEVKLVNKVKRLLKRANISRWLHHFGPKKYEFYQHALAFLVMRECRLGYRRVSRLLNDLGHKTPSYSALAKMAGRMPNYIWNKLLEMSNTQKLNIIAIDGSGLSRPLPSPYYYRRIDKPYPVDIPLKHSIAVDTRTRKIVAVRIRAKNSHDIKDSKYLIRRIPSKPRCLVADRGYDAEWLHKFCNELGIRACIPLRDYGKSKHNNWSLRRQAKFDRRTYKRRQTVEAVFSATKRKFGASISSIKVHTRRAEIYCRAIAHNILFRISEDFQRNL
jgi:transposase